MAKYLAHNPYLGVNPYLNSALQTDGWESFHATYIETLRRHLDRILPSGYYALSEKALQITHSDEYGVRIGRPHRMLQDVSVYREPRETGGGEPALSGVSAIPKLVLSLDLEDDDETVNAVVIYKVRDEIRFRGQPITRIELLSPANMRGGSHHTTYQTKRLETFHNDLRLIEIDFLHELPPIVQELPNYVTHQTNAYPYSILVNDIMLHKSAYYGVYVDEGFGKIAIPLDEEKNIGVDFDRVYDMIIEDTRGFRLLAEYDQEPDRMHTYSAADQARIRHKMAEIAALPEA